WSPCRAPGASTIAIARLPRPTRPHPPLVKADWQTSHWRKSPVSQSPTKTCRGPTGTVPRVWSRSPPGVTVTPASRSAATPAPSRPTSTPASAPPSAPASRPTSIPGGGTDGSAAAAAASIAASARTSASAAAARIGRRRPSRAVRSSSATPTPRTARR
ncbi:MAG: hypothetical protein AVDCRST_MAG54-991, partial [uncultured Actinomycetospora sp.]